MTNVKKQIEIFSSEGLFQLTTQTMKKCSHNEMHVHDGHQSEMQTDHQSHSRTIQYRQKLY